MRQIYFEYWDILGKQTGTNAGDSRTVFRLPLERFMELGIQTGDYFVLNNTRHQVVDASLVDPTMAELFCVITTGAKK